MDNMLPFIPEELGEINEYLNLQFYNKDVIIIAQTAYGHAGDREKALKAGCNDYISKPIKKEELLALIQKLFEK